MKQQKIEVLSSSLSSSKVVNKRKLNKLVAGYVVEEMLPISTVESPTFRKIINKIPMARSCRGLPDRKTFANYLDNAYSVMETELKKTFEKF